jgi:hypothetical protein
LTKPLFEGLQIIKAETVPADTIIVGPELYDLLVHGIDRKAERLEQARVMGDRLANTLGAVRAKARGK